MNIYTVQIILLNLYISIVQLFTIGSGDHLGFAGIPLTTGDIGQDGGIHTTALILSCIGIIAIGIIIIILFAPTALDITTITTTVQCTTVYVATTWRIATLIAHSLRAMLRAT